VHGPFTLRFGIPGYRGLTTVAVQDLDEFDTIVRFVGKLAREQAMSIQVDLRAAPPGGGGAVLIQFLVGQDERSSLLWYEDGTGFAAVDPYLPRRPCSMHFTHIHDVGCAPPDQTQVTQSTVHDALAVYLLTGERTKWLGWREIPAASDRARCQLRS
jgi:hypothetical protein